MTIFLLSDLIVRYVVSSLILSSPIVGLKREGRGIWVMEELHTDSIDGGHEGQLWARSRARERAYSNTPTRTLTGSGLGLC
jgi:hypothetical protein